MHTAVYRFSGSCSALELMLEIGNDVGSDVMKCIRIKLFTYMNGGGSDTRKRWTSAHDVRSIDVVYLHCAAATYYTYIWVLL
jgi:hypothetical protein